jgi:hypothetical protein
VLVSVFLSVFLSVSVSVRVRAKCGVPYREEVRWCARCDIAKEKVLYMYTERDKGDRGGGLKERDGQKLHLLSPP